MNKYFNFLFVTRKDAESERITAEIERNKLYRVHGMSSAHESLEAIKRGGYHCLVFNFDVLNDERLKLVTTFRDVGFTAPIVIFTSVADKDTLERMQQMAKIVVVEKPFESKDVWGICQKLLQGQRVNQRIFRRYYTNQHAAIEKTTTGETLDGHIFNLSRGGAYFEWVQGYVRPGDFVRVSIPLDKVQRHYNVDAEVVWITPAGGGRARAAAGLRFVTSSDVYRNLLSKL